MNEIAGMLAILLLCFIRMGKNQDIKDIFTIFHDGCIKDYECVDNDLKLTMEINFLAELMDKTYEFINLILFNVNSFYFEPWTGSITQITDKETIFGFQLCVVSTEFDENNNVVVHCNCLENDHVDFEGGKLIIECDDFSLTDQVGNPLTLNQLKELSSHYWNDIFGNE